MRGSPGVGVASAALIVLGLSPVIVSPSPGTVVTVAGILLLVAFVVVVFRGVWRPDERRAERPDPPRREHRGNRVMKRK